MRVDSVPADNVLLSADCRDTFLCDFGLSQKLDDSGWSVNVVRGEWGFKKKRESGKNISLALLKF